MEVSKEYIDIETVSKFSWKYFCNCDIFRGIVSWRISL